MPVSQPEAAGSISCSEVLYTFSGAREPASQIRVTDHRNHVPFLCWNCAKLCSPSERNSASASPGFCKGRSPIQSGSKEAWEAQQESGSQHVRSSRSHSRGVDSKLDAQLWQVVQVHCKVRKTTLYPSPCGFNLDHCPVWTFQILCLSASIVGSV